MNREAFEANYASSHDLPLETFSQYRMGDTYRLPGIASHYRTFIAAIESVVVELPAPDYSYDNFGGLLAKEDVIKAIEAAGLKVAP